MNNIEMTDVDGDALTIISREGSTWITCTSGRDEVTVGPFPTRLVDGVLERGLGRMGGLDQEGGITASLMGKPVPSAASAEAPDDDARDRAWEAFVRGSETGSVRDALDSAIAAAASAPPRPTRTAELAAELRRVAVTVEDADDLAAHLVTLGYRKD
ncbi:hypothetical protein ACT3SP_15290 [Brachybacterium sp. AOP43-C2-M15]|uniref:hypothetical protein n=1 Tax=Brachybacterium sp. AOP43-C2-M15 TaxID=3457661 RepID=UPI0040336409